jgi:hypothetical protein
VQGSPSTATSLRVQSQQLLAESQVFEDEVLPGTESDEHPAEEMSERRDHSKNLTGIVGIQLFAKSFILQVYDVLATHSCFSCFQTPVNKGELQSRRLRPLWWQLPERFRSLAVYEVSHKCPENISHFLIVRL